MYIFPFGFLKNRHLIQVRIATIQLIILRTTKIPLTVLAEVILVGEEPLIAGAIQVEVIHQAMVGVATAVAAATKK